MNRYDLINESAKREASLIRLHADDNDMSFEEAFYSWIDCFGPDTILQYYVARHLKVQNVEANYNAN